MMKMRTLWILAPLTLLGCASADPVTREPAQLSSVLPQLKPLSRDEVYGPNRARVSVRPKANLDYIFRNVASAFPDTGKNMLLKDRAVPKSTVTTALDNSPWHLRLYNDPEHKAENQKRFSSANKNFYSTPLTQREAGILSQAAKKPSSEPLYHTESAGMDDPFEPNNDMEHAFDLSNSEDRWLALLGPKNAQTEGVQWDDDWYKILVSPHYRRLMLDLRFQQYLGDIDMKLFDSQGQLIAVSQGNGDDEFIHLILDKGGVYYVQITGANRGNRYDFKYSTFFTGGSDDEYEENDRLSQATDLRNFEGRWLSEVRGEGVAADDDYYMIRVPAGKLRVLVDLRVDVDRGDVDVRLLNSQGKTIASSANINDDDFIDFTVPTPGIYYLKVYPFSPQGGFNMYDLKWSTEKPSQGGMSKSYSKSQIHQREAVR